MNRDALIQSLRRPDPASQECSSAVAQGAEFEVFEETVAIPELLTIYRRRQAHVDAIGVDHGGFDQALDDLEAYEGEDVRVGQVTDRVAQRHYQLFLSGNHDAVVACLWVRSHVSG